MTSPSIRRDSTGTLYLVPGRYHRDQFFDHSQFDPPRGSAFILSVDDDPLVLSTRQAVLEISGYEVLNAADGRQALDILANRHVDLAILDYRLPRFDGGMLAREMKRQRPPLPIVMVSGEVVEEEIKDYADSFLTKGQSPKLLLGEIERLLASSKSSVRAASGF